MSEGELLSLATERDSLTDLARQILSEELALRGLGEDQIEEWKHPPAPAQRRKRTNHWERKTKRWKTAVRQLYDWLPVSPFWLIAVVFLGSFRWFFKWSIKVAGDFAPLVVLAVLITSLIVVILLPVQRGK